MAESNPDIQCTHCGGEFIRLVSADDRPAVCPVCLRSGHDNTDGMNCNACRRFAAKMVDKISEQLRRSQ